MLRAVIDTNTWLSGLIWGGPPRQIVLLALAQQLRCLTCNELVAEFQRVMAYPRIDKVLLQRSLSGPDLVSQFGLLSDIVQTPALLQPVCRDPDDDWVLACAVAANADLIVSGDADLLTLGNFQDIPILTASQALAFLKADRA